MMDNDFRILFVFIPLGAYLGFKAGRANRENMTLAVTIISLLLVFGIYGIGYSLNAFQLISMNDIIALIKDLSASVFFVLIGVWVSWGLVA
jgi:hypothetical protein